jgi:hypothetical protein
MTTATAARHDLRAGRRGSRRGRGDENHSAPGQGLNHSAPGQGLRRRAASRPPALRRKADDGTASPNSSTAMYG